MPRFSLFFAFITILIPLSLIAQPVGETYLCGNTWYEIQHHGNVGRMIGVDDLGWSQMVWTKGLQNGSSLRHIFYNGVDSEGNILASGGIQVDAVQRAGYATIAVGSDNRAYPCFHQQSSGVSDNNHTAVAFDFFPHVGAFMTTELPWVYQGGNDMEIIWPVCAVDIDDKIHIASLENPTGTEMGIYYGWGQLDELTYTMETCVEQDFVANTKSFAVDIAASPVSNRVALGWTKNVDWGAPDWNRNDLLLVISEDGQTWNWNDTINITNWIPPDLSQLPDTTSANRDTLRCHNDMCLFFDYNDVLHVIFTVRHYYAIQGIYPGYNGFIYHWDEISQDYSLVANGWFANGGFEPDASCIYVCRPSAAVDEVSGDIYCLYNRFAAPMDTNLTFPFQWADMVDFSAAGFPNAEVWVAKSSDGGASWTEGINVTDTQSPGAPAGLCLSEIQPSMSVNLFQDRLDIFYELDKDAGSAANNQGTVTLNDMYCQRIPLSEIPAGAILPYYPIHVEYPPPEIALSLQPYGIPIQIPPQGGNFTFGISIDNGEPNPIRAQVWTMAILPDSSEYGPIINVGFNFPPGQVSRERTQVVPANTPAGFYTYKAFIGLYPDTIYDWDSFEFEKLGGN